MSTAPEAPQAWRRQPERGSVLGIRLLVHILDHLGREFLGFVLWPVCVYFALFATNARAASVAYLQRMGLPTTFFAVVRHLWTFARVSVDRTLFLGGQTDQFDLHTHGHETIAALAHKSKEGKTRGALLLGAHLGSFEAMRALAVRYDFPVAVVADFGNARRINGIFAELHPNLHLDLIERDPEKGTWMLEVKERTDQGRLVALLSDRVAEGRPERVHTGGYPRAVTVDFLGGRASFPTGAFIMAHVAKCPVYLVFAMFDGGRRYDAYCELLSERIELPRSDREGALVRYVQAYADRLAAHVELAPWNWFNFFDFWSPEGGGEKSP